MSVVDVAGRGRAVVHQAEDFLAGICAQFADPATAEPGAPVLEAAQTAVYYALGCWLDAPVIVAPLADGLLALARARTRVGQAAFHLPRHHAEPTPPQIETR